MRQLTMSEIGQVAGAGDDSSGGSTSGNNIEGISNFAELGNDLVAFYEGLVQVTSHIIERVANAL